MHIPIGAIVVLLAHWMETPGAIVGLAFYLGFLKYETNSDRWKKDQAWIDIMGSLIGIPLTAGVLWMIA